MPILVLVLSALFGLGYVAHEELLKMKAEWTAAEATVAPDPGPSWARACSARLVEAADDFERLAPAGGCRGEATIARLPSGVAYVEYNLHRPDGSEYQVAVTEEPQHEGDGERTGWHGAPGCRGYDHGFEVVRHENGRLARVYASGGGPALEFARAFEAAADFCVERAQ
jgi:hypothetical protein